MCELLEGRGQVLAQGVPGLSSQGDGRELPRETEDEWLGKRQERRRARWRIWEGGRTGSSRGSPQPGRVKRGPRTDCEDMPRTV